MTTETPGPWRSGPPPLPPVPPSLPGTQLRLRQVVWPCIVAVLAIVGFMADLERSKEALSEDTTPRISQGPSRIKKDAIACPTRDSYSAVQRMGLQGDLKAATLKAAVSGCTTPSKGELVHHEDLSLWSGLTQVRRPGELTTWWLPMEDVGR